MEQENLNKDIEAAYWEIRKKHPEVQFCIVFPDHERQVINYRGCFLDAPDTLFTLASLMAANPTHRRTMQEPPLKEKLN